ncbi:MAG: D-arabinose 5-phosphate isomerase, partial [Ignavibacteria bacterium]|nr:D-arabinose 5-phosphate isomerase [Ignavibacteria bacterium]
MKTAQEIQNIGIQVIEDEMNAIKGLIQNINNDFAKTVEAILSGRGNVVVSGIGKSANIAQKIVATLN